MKISRAFNGLFKFVVGLIVQEMIIFMRETSVLPKKTQKLNISLIVNKLIKILIYY